MAKSAIHLIAHHAGHSLDASATGFLLGPRGQVWDLDLAGESPPRLLVDGEDGRPLLAGASGPGESVYFSIGNRAHYLSVRLVHRRGPDLVDAGQAAQIKGGTVMLAPSDAGLQLLDANDRDSPLSPLSLLRAPSHWTTHGRVEGSHLLIHPAATSAWQLLNFVAGVKLPSSFTGHAAWERPLQLGPRGRLSPLAARQAA